MSLFAYLAAGLFGWGLIKSLFVMFPSPGRALGE